MCDLQKIKQKHRPVFCTEKLIPCGDKTIYYRVRIDFWILCQTQLSKKVRSLEFCELTRQKNDNGLRNASPNASFVVKLMQLIHSWTCFIHETYPMMQSSHKYYMFTGIFFQKKIDFFLRVER